MLINQLVTNNTSNMIHSFEVRASAPALCVQQMAPGCGGAGTTSKAGPRGLADDAFYLSAIFCPQCYFPNDLFGM